MFPRPEVPRAQAGIQPHPVSPLARLVETHVIARQRLWVSRCQWRGTTALILLKAAVPRWPFFFGR